MTTVGPLRARAAERGWRIGRDPLSIVAYVLVIDVVTVCCTVVSAMHFDARVARSWVILGLLIGLALAFEEGSRHVGRMRIRLSNNLTRDMTSVWSIAAAVALPPALAIVLHVVLFTFIWFRQEWPAGESLYRRIGSRCTVVLGCLAAGAARRELVSDGHMVSGTLAGAASVLVVIVVHAAVNRSLVTVALLLLGARRRDLLSSNDENLLELATLCLGGMVALAALHERWLCLLVLPPMISLQRGAAIRELETAATTDAKTGLLNAIALEHVGQQEIARAARAQTSLAVLLLDIDRFKAVNDRHGHLVGDSVLRGIGAVLSGGIREYDSVGRFGGEEFVAILPIADEDEALVIAERLRSRVADLRVSSLDPRAEPGEGDGLSVSIGVACYGVDGLALADLLFAADSALYVAKASGRNCVVLADRGLGDQARDVVAG